jgi:hypothetical protein
MVDERVSTQLAIESVCGRSNIRRWIRNRIEQEQEYSLLTWAIGSENKLHAWLNQTFGYASKNARIDLIRDWEPRRLSIEIATAVLHKEGDKTFREIAGYLSAVLPHEDVFDRVKTAAELLAVCDDFGLYHIQKGSPAKIVTGYALDIEVYDWIKETIPALPMLCEPAEVTDNDHCGYLSYAEPVIMNRHAQHAMPIALDVINLLNRQCWEIDPEVLAIEAECAKEPLNTKEQFENHFRMARDSQLMYGMIVENGNQFWMNHQYDSRGRIYSRGYHVNLQSTEYKKAMLNFRKRELIQ